MAHYLCLISLYKLDFLNINLITIFHIINSNFSILTSSSYVLVLSIKLNRIYFCIWNSFCKIMRNIYVTIGDQLYSKWYFSYECSFVIGNYYFGVGGSYLISTCFSFFFFYCFLSINNLLIVYDFNRIKI
jgi:hypothetical protein